MIRPKTTHKKIFIAAGLAALIGSMLIFIAVAANALGLDNNTVWGPKRIVLAGAGGGFWLVAVALLFSVYLAKQLQIVLKACGRINAAVTAWPPLSWLKRQSQRVAAWPVSQFLFGSSVKRVAFGLALVFIAAVAWYTHIYQYNLTSNSGFHTGYYELLAQGFIHGKAYLPTQPPAALLKLVNPYEFQQRKDIPGVLWDTSLYQGRYYLYWGPIPALMITAVKLVLPFEATDDRLALAFTIGVLVFSLLLLATMWLKRFRLRPAGLVVVAGLMVAFNYALGWLVSEPSIYEAAIAGGQCFLMAGFLWLYLGLENRRMRWPFLLAGLSLGLAVGCRLSLAVTVVFVFLGVSAVLAAQKRLSPNRLGEWLLLLLPLIFAAAGLGWYNWVRFGSILETGHRFQLGSMDMYTAQRAVMGLEFILPNFYTYVLRPFQIVSRFPYLYAPAITQYMWPAHLTIPSHYQYSEAVTGVLPSSPYLWLALMPVVMLIPQGWRWLRREKQDKLFDRMTWLEVGLVGIALLESALMLLYTYSSMRYLNDWLPTLYLVAALGMWRWDELNQFHLVQQRLLRWAVGILALVSLVISLGLNLANILK